jgi:hypothetical protein
MNRKVKEPEEMMGEKMDRLKLTGEDIYDVLGYLIRRYGLKAVVGEFKNYLGDQTSTAFDKVDIAADGSCFIGLSKARAWDACTCLVECLLAKVGEYEL